MRTCLGAVIALAVIAFGADGASAATRYATPTGTGTACTQAAPCGLKVAIEGSPAGIGIAAGDEVVLGSGSYGTAAAPLSTSIARSLKVNLHGIDGGKPPKLFFSVVDGTDNGSALYALALDGTASTVKGFELRNVATGSGAGALRVGGGSTIDHVLAATAGLDDTSGSGIYSTGFETPATSTIRNSIFVASNPLTTTTGNIQSGTALYLSYANPPSFGRLVNVTAATAPGVGGAALLVLGSSFGAMPAVNTLIAGRTLQGETAQITFSHSLLAQAPEGSSTYVKLTDTAIGAASLVDPVTGDVTQKPDSLLTIDRGVAVTDLRDFGGDLRTLGTAPDIGADEIPALPVPAVVGVDAVTETGATVRATVDPGGRPTSYRLEYGAGRVAVAGTPALDPEGGAQAVSFALTGLTPATSYPVRVVATNERGEVVSPETTFTAAATPVVAVVEPQAEPTKEATPVPAPAPLTQGVPPAVPATPAAPPVPTPGLTVSAPTLGRASGGRLSVGLTNTSTQPLTVTAQIESFTGKTTASIAAGRRGTIVLKPTTTGARKLAKSSRHRVKATLVLAIRGADGKARTVKVQVTVRR